MRDLRTDERGVIIDWLGKTLLVFMILGFFAFEAGAVLVNFFSLDSKADEIAITVSTEISDGSLEPTNTFALKQATRPLAKEAGAKLKAVVYNPADGTLQVVIKRQASTLLMDRVDAFDKWTVAESTGKAGTH